MKPSPGAGATAYGGLLSVNLVEGQWLAVVGCGGLGHLLIQFAKAKSLKVLAGEPTWNDKHPLHALMDFPIVDIRDSALSLARSLGADITLNSSSPTAKADFAEIVPKTGGGVHASILLAESQAALELSAEVTRKHGTVCLIAAVSLLSPVLPYKKVAYHPYPSRSHPKTGRSHPCMSSSKTSSSLAPY
jgi:D-arabinose 1-dehydrogenase-like Zn-dependent alcohol dehydrogenase